MPMEDIERYINGPQPEQVSGYHFLGVPLNEDAVKKSMVDTTLWQAAQAIKIQQALNPMRGASLGQISALSGVPADVLATPEQMTNRSIVEPSQVPRFNFQQSPSSLTLTPPEMSIRPGIEGPEKDMYLSTLTPGELDNRWDLPSYQPFRATMAPSEGPPAPGMAPQMRSLAPNKYPLTIDPRAETVLPGGTRIPIDIGRVATQPDLRPGAGEFKPEQGPPLERTVQEPNLGSPSNIMQQTIGMANIERMKKWPTRGMGGSAWQQKYATIHDAFGKDVADFWAAEGYLPGGAKELNLLARTDSSEAGAGLKRNQSDLYRKRVSTYDVDEELKNRNIESQIRSREQRDRITKAESATLQRLRSAQADLAEMKVDANTPEREIAAKEASVKVMQGRLKTLQDYLVMADKFDQYSKEAENIAAEDLAKDINLEGPGVHEPTFLESAGQKLGITKVPPITRRDIVPHNPGGEEIIPKAQAAPDAGDMISKQIEELLKLRGVDPAQAEKEGVTFKGKTYHKKGGKWAE